MSAITFKQQLPQARKEGLLFTPLNDELVIYDTERNKAHSLNRVATLVWQNCDGKTSVGELRTFVAQELQAEIDEQVVWLALQQLERNRLLEGPIQPPRDLLSRREAARRLGKAAAIALPIVASMLIPPAVAASSGGFPTGFPCSVGSQCASGVCSGGICT